MLGPKPRNKSGFIEEKQEKEIEIKLQTYGSLFSNPTIVLLFLTESRPGMPSYFDFSKGVEFLSAGPGLQEEHTHLLQLTSNMQIPKPRFAALHTWSFAVTFFPVAAAALWDSWLSHDTEPPPRQPLGTIDLSLRSK